MYVCMYVTNRPNVLVMMELKIRKTEKSELQP